MGPHGNRLLPVLQALVATPHHGAPRHSPIPARPYIPRCPARCSHGSVVAQRMSCLCLDEQATLLLANLSGEAKMGRLLALMGPLGSGKMMLLNVLAGQLTASPSLHLSDYLYVNGHPMSQPMSQGGYKIAYVWQEYIFFSRLIMRDTLSLAVELQLLDTMSPERKEKYVLASSWIVTVSDSDLDEIIGISDSSALEERDPPEALQCYLRPYQKQALHWMLQLEKGSFSRSTATPRA